MKKVLSLIAIVAAFAMFALTASAFTVVTEGDTVRIFIDESGDINGTLQLETTGSLELERERGANGVLVAAGPNGIAVAGLGLEAGDEIANFRFSGEGTATFSGELEVDGEAISLNVTEAVGEEEIIVPVETTQATVVTEPAPVETEPAPVETNPKNGVIFAIVPALVAGAAVAVARKRK